MHAIFAYEFYGPATEWIIKDAANADVTCDEDLLDGKIHWRNVDTYWSNNEFLAGEWQCILLHTHSSLTDHHTNIKECQQHICCKHNMYSWRYVPQPKSLSKF